MLVYRSQWQDIEDNDVIEYKWQHYVVVYMMEATAFVLYPLGWHTLSKLSWDTLDTDEDWTYIWHLYDEEVAYQLPDMQWPYFRKIDNIKYYLTNIK